MPATKSLNPNQALSVARKVHPEDLSVGDHVVLAEIAYEFPSFTWCGADTTVFPPETPIRISFLPMFDPHEPMQVKQICLPFVLCKPSRGDHRVVDLRLVNLARVDMVFAKAVQQAIKSDKKQRRKISEAGSNPKSKRKAAKKGKKKKK